MCSSSCCGAAAAAAVVVLRRCRRSSVLSLSSAPMVNVFFLLEVTTGGNDKPVRRLVRVRPTNRETHSAKATRSVSRSAGVASRRCRIVSRMSRRYSGGSTDGGNNVDDP
jgi:hypothetical protein